jgi:hypothetical protein
MKKKHVKVALGVATGLLLTAIFGSVARDVYTLRNLERDGGAGRPLTTGEISMARQVYGDDLDYGAIRLYNTARYGDDARAHGNNIYLETDALHVADFSNPAVGKDEKKILMHELFHVLKSQKGGSGFWANLTFQPAHIVNNLFGTRLGYDFDINSSKPFSDLNEEQQASMVEEYFRALQTFDRVTRIATEPADAQLREDVRAEVARFEQKLKSDLPLPGARTLTLNPQ